MQIQSSTDNDDDNDNVGTTKKKKKNYAKIELTSRKIQFLLKQNISYFTECDEK